MTVTLVAGHLKPFDIGKWISVDEGGFWVTRKLLHMTANESTATLSLDETVASPWRIGATVRTVGHFDYIQITAMTEDGMLPAHLAGIRKVELDGHHGDLKMK